ncbi:hypothetical protein G9C98_003197 [Cotesia typhae]|uniref:Uncharacterized protein n=1 Tax=Cotesia typhae TaxID=2053667 RepID=A0A8J5R176_9HYME|nr:hypothetical protein G9C98_003197 [Cotesia typhae]
MPSKCAEDCPKSKKRREAYEKTLREEEKSPTFQESEDDVVLRKANKNLQSNYDDDDTSDGTEYLSFSRPKSSARPESSRPKRSKERYVKSKHEKKYSEHREKFEEDVCASKTSTRRRRNLKKNRKFSSRFNENCVNEECSGIPKRKVETEESEESLTSDISCPSRCELDLTLLPSPSSPCDSSCPKQALLDQERERHQEEVDKYLLHGGLRYFDDLCHCSLKCLLTQICGDKFIQKTASSTAFFLLGIKLCFELEAWYIPF